MLTLNKAAVKAQTKKIIKHTILADEEGIGCAKANHLLSTFEPEGKWVWVVDDDEKLARDDAASLIQRTAKANPKVGLIVVNGTRDGATLPHRWPLHEGGVGGLNVVVRKDVWMQYREFWKERYAADWDFICAMLAGGVELFRLEEVLVETQAISHGKPEAGGKYDFDWSKLDDWQIKVGERFIANVGFSGNGISASDGDLIIANSGNINHIEMLLNAGHIRHETPKKKEQFIRET